jgi:hypothetical protein
MTEQSQTPTALGNYFGRLAEVNHFYARFEPLAMVQDGSWVRFDDRKRRFSRNSGVQVPPAELDGHTAIGGFWFFRREALGTPDDRTGAERPIRAIPVLDLRHLSMSDARRKVLKDGVRLPDHQPRQALIFLPDGKYGRFKFEKAGSNWLARLPTDGVVVLRQSDPSWSTYQHSDEFGYLPFEVESTSPGERVDWTPDREFLSKLLDRYKAAVDAYFGLSQNSADDPAKRLHRALTDARVLGEETRISEASIKRLREGLPAALDALEALRELGDLLLKSDAGKMLLQRAVDARTQSMAGEIAAQARSELEKSLQSRRDEVLGLDEKIRSLRAETAILEANDGRLRKAVADSDRALKAASDELAERRRAMTAASVNLDAAEKAKLAAEEKATEAAIEETAASERVRAMSSELERMSRELLDASDASNLSADERMSDLGMRIRAILGGSQAEIPTHNHGAPWWLPVVAEPTEIGIADLPGRLAHQADFRGVEEMDIRLMDAALRSGELVMLIGPAAELALGAFSCAAAGGRIRSQVIDPSVIGLDDLWRVPGSHRPTAFAMAWNRALQEPDVTVLLCLRNIDAAPFRLWLRSLRVALSSLARPRNLVVAATTIGWPSNDVEYPDALALRHDLMAIKPRFSKDSHRCDYALGAQADRPTLLKADEASEDAKLSAPPAQLRQAGLSPDTVHRVLRLKAMLEEPLTKTVVLPWAAFLTSAKLDDLQDPLREAHAELKDLHLQR